MKLLSIVKRRKSDPQKPEDTHSNSLHSPIVNVLRTLVVVYDPIVDKITGKRMSEYMKWNDVETLARGFMSDMLLASGGLIRYKIIERYDVDDFPAKIDSFKYEAESYLNVMRGSLQPYLPQEADYNTIIKEFDILKRISQNEIDEVWVFNFPHAGFYESIMGGPGAFWCNAPPLRNTDAAGKKFVVMGFSFERGVGEMLENMGHRVESIMEKVFERTPDPNNLWKRFIRYDKSHPGQAALGNVHFAPNSERDYDWNNPRSVPSECDDWLNNFPEFKGDIRNVSAKEWGNGDIRKHHLWWLSHIPKKAGTSHGILNNWWQYIANPTLVKSK